VNEAGASRAVLTAALMRAVHTRLDRPRLIDDPWCDRFVSAAEKAALCQRILDGVDLEARKRLETLGSQQAIIGQLYAIERAATEKHLDAPARQRLRQEQGRPILEKLHAYLQEHATVLPKSPLGTAIGYALRNWVALTPTPRTGAQDRQHPVPLPVSRESEHEQVSEASLLGRDPLEPQLFEYAERDDVDLVDAGDYLCEARLPARLHD
jgi:transposase IS66 family protein/leucine carboxyl methyltransferase